MKYILQASLSANGSPSEVRARIADQVKAASSATEQAAALATMRTFIDKTVEGVSEDDTLSVVGSIAIIVENAPPIVTARTQAIVDELEAAKKELAERTQTLTEQIEAVKAELEAVRSPTGGA